MPGWQATGRPDPTGFARGGPVDRHYIEAFHHLHRADIRGRGAGELTPDEYACHEPEYSLLHAARVQKPAVDT